MRSYECSSWKYVNWVWCIEVQLETCRLQIVHCAVPMGTFFWQTLLIPLSGSLSQPSKQVLLRWIRRRWACNMFHTSVTWWHPCFSQDTWDGLGTVCTIFGRVRIQIWYLDVERNVDTYFMQFVSKPYAQSFWIILVLVSGHFLETCQGRSETMAKRHLTGMIRPGSSPLAIEQEL